MPDSNSHSDSEIVRRFDRMSFGKVTRTDTGYLADAAIITRAGVFKYRMPDGSVRSEFRSPDEVFRGDSLATARMMPLTNGHPEGFVTPENAKDLAIGFTGNDPHRDGDNLVTQIKVSHKDGIEAVERGRRQLSCGYRCRVDRSDGDFRGEPFTHVQRDIQYNHLALVDQGRAGEMAALRLDAADACMVDDVPGTEGNRTMPDTRMVRLDSGREYSASPEVADAYQALREDAADKVKQIQTMTASRDSLEAERDELKSKLDEALKVDHSPAIAAGVKERMSVEKAARSILDDKQIEKLDSMSNDEIRKAVILSKHQGINLAGKSPEYVGARFDAIVESIPADKMDAQGKDLVGAGEGRKPKEKSADQIRRDAIEAQMAESRKALAQD